MNKEMTEVKVEETKKKKKWWLLLLLLLSFAGGFYYFQQQSTPAQLVVGDYLPDAKDAKKMSDQELKAAEQKEVDASKFNMVIKPKATFATGQAEGDLYIQNPTSNAYPIDVVIHLDDTNEQVYSSGAMTPGFEINQAKLDKELAAGSYPATATFNIYDDVTKEKRGQVQAGIMLEING